MIEPYKSYAEMFKPEKIKYLFIGESPPEGKRGEKNIKKLKYFYNYNLKVNSSPLLKNIYWSIIRKKIPAKQKREPFLHELKEKGVFLIDATYTPINKKSDDIKKFIEKDYPILKSSIEQLCLDKKAKLFLVGKRVDKCIGEKIKKDFGDYVKVGFPICRCQKYDKTFKRKIQKTY